MKNLSQKFRLVYNQSLGQDLFFTYSVWDYKIKKNTHTAIQQALDQNRSFFWWSLNELLIYHLLEEKCALWLDRCITLCLPPSILNLFCCMFIFLIVFFCFVLFVFLSLSGGQERYGTRRRRWSAFFLSCTTNHQTCAAHGSGQNQEDQRNSVSFTSRCAQLGQTQVLHNINRILACGSVVANHDWASL